MAEIQLSLHAVEFGMLKLHEYKDVYNLNLSKSNSN